MYRDATGIGAYAADLAHARFGEVEVLTPATRANVVSRGEDAACRPADQESRAAAKFTA
jgi:hypothetical protein